MKNNWNGQRITDTLSISPSPSSDDRWVIHGDDQRGKGVGSGEDMVKLAKLILENLVDEHENDSIPCTN